MQTPGSYLKDRLAARFSGPTTDRFGWILLAGVTGICLSMMAAALWYYRSMSRENEDAAQRSLFAITQTRSNQVDNWRRERMADGRI